MLSVTIALGDVTGDLSTNNVNSTVDSNNSSNTTNYNGAGSSPNSQPVMSAVAPTVMGGGGSESCLIPTSQGISLSIIGLATGTMEQDKECNRRRDARLLGSSTNVGGLGLQISGISVMCSNPVVYRAMTLANTPCPLTDITTGRLLIGRDAYLKMREDPVTYIVGYDLDRNFWNTILLIGKELPDVQEEDTSPSLSSRFRDSGESRSINTKLTDSSK